MVSLPERRRAVTYLKNEYPVSERRACAVLSENRSSYRHQGTPSQIDDVYREVMRLSERYSYWGYRKIYDLIDRRQSPIVKIHKLNLEESTAAGATSAWPGL